MNDPAARKALDELDHIALAVDNIESAVAWYTGMFNCSIEYQDKTWAFLKFKNIKLALVLPDQHPSHIALYVSNAGDFGTLKAHRDGTKSVYVKDPAGNSVELFEMGEAGHTSS